MSEQREEDEVFNTPRRRRCRDCCYLAENEDGTWICTDFDCGEGTDIEEIDDEDCSLNIPAL